jgi:hypothetical protein
MNYIDINIFCQVVVEWHSVAGPSGVVRRRIPSGGNQMKRKALGKIELGKIVLGSFAVFVVVAAASGARVEDAKASYPQMAPVEQYMMERSAEIALAKSAAPPSISGDAEVMVMGRQGYEVAVKGKNGFVCMVERSWMAPIDDPSFWNPKLRGPICLNPAAARSYLPRTIKKTELILAIKSKAQMVADIQAALDKKELPAPEPGAMCYMMSRQGYLSDSDGHWHPHLMFFAPLTDPVAWGAGLPGSPVIAFKGAEGMTIFLVPVVTWSDGTTDSMGGH